ncbi:uncharacterized protein PG986_005436 [Apiospora aurea]|uniref:Uncharacterized protein n=1 Tax=Apiospora aurea TaxID=335848 RepID=A0ABR1QHJ2_9PEZI
MDRDPWGMEPRSLTVIKKRRNPNGQSRSSENDEIAFGELGASLDSPEQNPTTPKHKTSMLSRRASSYQVLRSTPKLLTKLRSFSNGRALSSKATCRRYDLRERDTSGSSYGSPLAIRVSSNSGPPESRSCSSTEASYDPEPFLPLGYDGFYGEQIKSNTCRPSGESLSSVQVSDGSSTIQDPYLLVPHVAITPEAKTLENGRTMLCRPYPVDYSRGFENAIHGNQSFLPVHHCEEGLSRYGYLYDIDIQVLPTVESVIIDVLNEPTSRVLGPGSSMLTLVQTHINASQPPHIDGKAHGDDPDGLMADLEYHLGNVQTEYIEVRLSYSHSGFPTFSDINGGGGASSSTVDGVSRSRTRLETRVTGVVTRNNPMSAWSPRPTPCAPVSNTLFAIIAAHWGPIRANGIMHRIIASRSTPRKVAVTTATTTTRKSPQYRHRRAGTDIRGGSDETVRATVPPERTATAPPLQVPRRQTSLQRGARSPEPAEDGGGLPGKARKIWTEMRRTSSGSQPSYYVSSIKRIPGSSTESLLPGMSAKSGTPGEGSTSRQELLRDMAMHDVVPEPMFLSSIVPTPEEYYVGGRRMMQHSEEELPKAATKAE